MFAALSKNWYNIRDELNHFVALGPAVRLANIKIEFFKNLAADVDRVYYFLDMFGINELFGPEWSLISAGFCLFNKSFCDKSLSDI